MVNNYFLYVAKKVVFLPIIGFLCAMFTYIGILNNFAVKI